MRAMRATKPSTTPMIIGVKFGWVFEDDGVLTEVPPMLYINVIKDVAMGYQ
jgi:hypothetical protein